MIASNARRLRAFRRSLPTMLSGGETRDDGSDYLETGRSSLHLDFWSMKLIVLITLLHQMAKG